MKKYPVITLCGSSKFKDEFIRLNEEFTLQGFVVISLGLFGHADNKFGNILTPEKKILLDDIHKQKIDMADVVFIVNVDNYIGDSTRNEIEYTESLGTKTIKYLENGNK